jgi:hypothetical protein
MEIAGLLQGRARHHRVEICISSLQIIAGPNASRIATYHYGPALNLATLQALQSTLLTEIAAI